MGEIVAAAIFGHQPAIMAPEAARMAMGRGRDTTLVTSIPEFRRRLDAARPDTFVVFDTHWFTTLEHVVAGAERFSGEYTSEELPGLLCDVPYDDPGAPELAAEVVEVARVDVILEHASFRPEDVSRPRRAPSTRRSSRSGATGSTPP